MPANVQFPFDTGYTTLVFVVIDSEGLYLRKDNGVKETYNSGNVSLYRVALAESPSGSGLYEAAFPVPVVLPDDFDVVAYDTNGLVEVGQGHIYLDADGNEIAWDQSNTYAQRADIEDIFGKTNVAKWADLDNAGDLNDIENRINWALVTAKNQFDDRLRGGPYLVPFAVPAPWNIMSMSARLAGVILYDSRGVADAQESDGKGKHALSMHRVMVEKFLVQCLSGAVRLNVAFAQNIPGVVKLHTRDDYEHRRHERDRIFFEDGQSL